tara:strand:+ start:1451 stop:2569 length:1119 start_codon:yes stop_codon:yes gene_type:complete
MRHLSVPSAQTQQWLEICRTHNWHSKEVGISRLEGGLNAIPLNDSAPNESDSVWGGNKHIVLEVQLKGPTHWLEHIEQELKEAYIDDWPRSYEVQGDVLIVKIEEAVWDFGEMIADAMLTQLPSIRLVCADQGVHGEFRVRKLHPLATRDGSLDTKTRVKEHGNLLWVDPSKAYFSSRLSNQRIETLATAKRLHKRLGRSIVVADPYAGIGPSMGVLLSEPALICGYLLGDLNPDAVELLALNIDYFSSRRKGTEGVPLQPLQPAKIHCKDAFEWAEDSSNCGQCDLVLVNLPHQSISHLAALLPLLRRDQTSVIRGWAIIERSQHEECERTIVETISSKGGTIEELSFTEVKGFSTTKSFMCFEAWINMST